MLNHEQNQPYYHQRRAESEGGLIVYVEPGRRLFPDNLVSLQMEAEELPCYSRTLVILEEGDSNP
jgi:hypothetical protein